MEKKEDFGFKAGMAVGAVATLAVGVISKLIFGADDEDDEEEEEEDEDGEEEEDEEEEEDVFEESYTLIKKDLERSGDFRYFSEVFEDKFGSLLSDKAIPNKTISDIGGCLAASVVAAGSLRGYNDEFKSNADVVILGLKEKIKRLVLASGSNDVGEDDIEKMFWCLSAASFEKTIKNLA